MSEPQRPNIYAPAFDQDRHAPEGFRAERALLGRQAGARQLGLSLWELAPGQSAYPLHFHMHEEEMIVALEGRLSVRGPDGWRELERGEVVSFLPGPDGAHQLANWSEERARFLSFSTSGAPDTVVYPDSKKVGISLRRPGGLAMRIRYDEEHVDYWEGETPPARP